MMNKLVYGVGINNKKHPAKIDGKQTKEYQLWKNMLQRCYCQKSHVKKPTYIGCSVSDNFRSYSYFYEWCHNQIGFNSSNGLNNWNLDKDILIPNNKIYSEDACVFVPREVNVFFTDSSNARGEWPVGVDFNKIASRFRSRCNVNGNLKYLGYFDTPEQAHACYKTFKEALCKELANKWRDKIDERVYNAMMSWSV